ncbi:hypothetical protein D3C75_406480 [compost metagenome]
MLASFCTGYRVGVNALKERDKQYFSVLRTSIGLGNTKFITMDFSSLFGTILNPCLIIQSFKLEYSTSREFIFTSALELK